jgi:hypothetical protein
LKPFKKRRSEKSASEGYDTISVIPENTADCRLLNVRRKWDSH